MNEINMNLEHCDNQVHITEQEYTNREGCTVPSLQESSHNADLSSEFRKSKEKKLKKETRKISSQRSNIKRKSAITATEKVQVMYRGIYFAE